MNPMIGALRLLCARALWAMAGAAMLALASGCGALPDKPVRAAVYDFGPGALSLPTGAARQLPALYLAEIDAPAALDSSTMLYRLAYADAAELRPYALARWSMAPAQLLRQRLQNGLETQRPVLGGAPSGAGLLLRVELEEFVHLFEAPERSAGLVRLRASLLRVSDGRELFLAQRRFVALRPATSQDAPGGVRALASASDAVVQELAQWLAGVQLSP